MIKERSPRSSQDLEVAAYLLAALEMITSNLRHGAGDLALIGFFVMAPWTLMAWPKFAAAETPPIGPDQRCARSAPWRAYRRWQPAQSGDRSAWVMSGPTFWASVLRARQKAPVPARTDLTEPRTPSIMLSILTGDLYLLRYRSSGRA